jgi:hypothetical protein
MSARFGLPVALALFLALLPTAIHSYVGVRVEDGLTAAAIPEALAGFSGTKTSRNATWGQRRFDATDWIERTYHAGAKDVRLVVVRSFDLKKLYHHPELAAAYGTDLRPAGIQRSSTGPTVVHTFESVAGGRQAVMYALLYDGVFVEDPLWFQLQTAGKLLVGGRRQMTLFFVHQSDVPAGEPLENTAAASVLRAAVEAFAQQQPGVSAAN